MSFWTELRVPTEQELLIGFYDLTGYMRYAETAEPQRLLGTMSGYFALTGQILAVAATLPSTGLAMTPAVFRSLQPDTRKSLKKHTPPITYIDAEDRRPAHRKAGWYRRLLLKDQEAAGACVPGFWPRTRAYKTWVSRSAPQGQEIDPSSRLTKTQANSISDLKGAKTPSKGTIAAMSISP